LRNEKSTRPGTKQVSNTKMELKGGRTRCGKGGFDIGVQTEAIPLGRWSGWKVSESARFVDIDDGAKCQKAMSSVD